MINPFDLPGPQFLVFYAALIIISIIVYFILWSNIRRDFAYRKPITDPYYIAYLRSGIEEVLRVAIANLVQRGSLKSSAVTFTTIPGEIACEKNEINKSILESCVDGKTFSQIQDADPILHHEGKIKNRLVADGLLLDAAQLVFLSMTRIIIIILLFAIATFKIYLAFQRGKRNVHFLVFLFIFSFVFFISLRLRRTRQGITAIKDLKALFLRFRDQMKTASATIDNNRFPFILAIYGLNSVSASTFPFLSSLKQRNEQLSSCGSSCGSSSCGSSCGGGGGCGGCGS